MQIDTSRMALDSERLAYRYSRTEETLHATGTRGGAQVTLDSYRRTESASLEFESYSALALARPAAAPLRPPAFVPLVAPAPAAPARSAPAPAADDSLMSGDGELLLLKLLIEILSGREVEVADIAAAAPADAASVATPAAMPAQQFSIDYSFSGYYLESEQTSFRASGSVETADGRRIDFDLQVEMARRFESTTSFSFQAGQRKDPLALDLDGAGVQLDGARYAFDLDADGSNEQIAFLGGADAFLALDIDGNGRIDDGNELFGARSGDGFADLARYDGDGNGWIDAADPVFADLLAWRRQADGSDRLDSLAALGVGALYLGSAGTPFELRGSANEALGAVRRSGVFLTEDGRAGALQQLDLVV